MAFWSRWFGGRAEPSAVNRVEELVDRLQVKGRIETLGQELVKFDPGGISPAELESWHKWRGIAAFRAGDRSAAFARFREASERFPNSATIAFSLGQEHEFRGEVDEMLSAFNRAIFPQVPAQFALMQARYCYLWNQYEHGWKYLEPVTGAYFQLKILDDNFLYMRGLPFFSQVWDTLAALTRQQGDFAKLDALTARAAAECTDFDFDRLQLKLAALKSGDFAAIEAQQRGRLADWRAQSLPTGHLQLQLATRDAQRAGDELTAFRLLDAVELTKQDFSWLADVRLLTKCELAHKFKNDSLEAELKQDFFRRQPLLFEPEHALNFSLLDYQDRLKVDYQKNRRAGA